MKKLSGMQKLLWLLFGLSAVVGWAAIELILWALSHIAIGWAG